MRKPTLELLTLSAAASRSRVNPSHSPDGDAGQTTSAICGPPRWKSSAAFGEDSLFSKMSQDSLEPDTSILLPETCPQSGTILAGEFYPQPKWAHPISAVASGLLPTPQAFDAIKGNGMGTDPEALERRLAQGGCSNLAEWAALGKLETFPTPTVNMVSGGANDTAPTVNAGKHGINLKGHVNRYPTPTAGDANNVTTWQIPVRFASLTTQRGNAGTLPTPRSRDWKGQSQRGIHAQGDALPNLDDGTGNVIGGKLNPEFVETLMGMPRGWSNVEPIDMAEYHGWLVGFLGTREYMRRYPEYKDLTDTFPRYGAEAWQDGTWEGDTPRLSPLSNKEANRVGRLTGLGNAQVPACVASAWRLLIESTPE